MTSEGEIVQQERQRYLRVANLVFGGPWALVPETYQTICDLMQYRVDGHRLSPDEIQDRIGAAPVRRGAARSGAVAVMPLYGVLVQRLGPISAMSGATSTDAFGAGFRQAVEDPGISALVIDMDSPGGSVYGVQELWQTIMDARGQKPIVAVANSLAASGAYWIATAADEIVVTPGGEVGSIGVFASHEDVSEAEAKLGVKTTLVGAGEKKLSGNPHAPLTDEARADLQGKVDAYYDMFVGAVSRGRGVEREQVLAGFGQGGTVLAKEAVRMGMADRVDTLQGTIDRLVGSRRAARSAPDRRRMALL